MKNKNLKLSLLLILTSGVVLTILFLKQTNDFLETQIQERDSTLSQMRLNDSIYIDRIKYYSKTLNDYIQNDKFIIGDRELSTDEFIDLYSQTLTDKDKLEVEKNSYESAYHQAMDSLKHYVLLYLKEMKGKEFYQYKLHQYIDSASIYKSFYEGVKKTLWH